MPFRLTEDDQPVAGKTAGIGPSRDVEADWESSFTAKTFDLALKCRVEYDGMIRYEFALKPKGKVGRISLVMPLKAEYATRYLYYPMGARGVETGTIQHERRQDAGIASGGIRVQSVGDYRRTCRISTR